MPHRDNHGQCHKIKHKVILCFKGIPQGWCYDKCLPPSPPNAIGCCLSLGISLSQTKIGGKAIYQYPLIDPAKVGTCALGSTTRVLSIILPFS